MKIIEWYKKMQAERNFVRSQQRLQSEFQIAERDGELWITFEGYYILPCSMLKLEAVEALLEIRKLHIND